MEDKDKQIQEIYLNAIKDLEKAEKELRFINHKSKKLKRLRLSKAILKNKFLLFWFYRYNHFCVISNTWVRR